MKNLFLIIVTFSLFACQQKEAPIDYVIFSGTVSNSDVEKVRVSGQDLKKEIMLKEDGTFSDTLFIEKEGYYSFYIGRESSALYLKKGFALNLSIDVEEFDESIKYTGKGEAENNVLAGLYLINEEASQDRKELFSKEETDFVTAIKTTRTKEEDFVNASMTDESYKQIQLKEISYEYGTQLLRYESYHPYFTGKDSFALSPDFNSNQIEINLNNEDDYKTTKNYSLFLSSILNEKIDEAYAEDEDYVGATLNTLASIENAYVKNEIIHDFSRNILNPDEDMQKVYDFITANTTNDEYKEEYTETYDRLKQLAKGMPSPSFNDYENHAGGTTSLTDLKGKYVYVDVWATWCGPCIREIPSLQAVEEEYHDKNIQFVSTSIDQVEDHDTWINMVKDKELGGTQLMADQAWKSQFVQDYFINGIPRFILIDPEGNIVSADAPRPSDPKLKDLFTELNI